MLFKLVDVVYQVITLGAPPCTTVTTPGECSLGSQVLVESYLYWLNSKSWSVGCRPALVKCPHAPCWSYLGRIPFLLGHQQSTLLLFFLPSSHQAIQVTHRPPSWRRPIKIIKLCPNRGLKKQLQEQQDQHTAQLQARRRQRAVVVLEFGQRWMMFLMGIGLE